MKNMKLAMKIGLGFGILILIVCLLGGIAIWNMVSIKNEATILAKEYMPEVSVSNDIERRTLETMYAMRGYALTGEQQYWDEGAQKLTAVQEAIKAAQEHANASPHLTLLQESVKQVNARVTEYQQFADETHAKNMAIQANRASLDIASATYIQNCYDFLESQQEQMLQEIGAVADATALKERLRKIALVSDIISAGNEVRVSTFKAQALRQPQLIQDVMGNFNNIDRMLRELKTMTRKQVNIEQIEKTQQAANDYKTTLNDLFANWNALEAANEQRLKIVTTVLEDARSIALKGIEETTHTSNQAVSLLSSASSIMIFGLILAIILAVIVAVIISRGIVIPLQKGIAFANAVARGDLSATVDVNQNDEIGVLANALRGMVGTIRDVLREMEMLASAIQEGKLSARADADRFSGGWRNLVAGTNGIVEAFVPAFRLIADYLARIATGEIPPQITERYSGDFEELKNHVNAFITNLQALTEAANRISNGDMSLQLQKRSEHDQLIIAFQRMSATISMLVAEAGRLTDAAVQGKLSTRGDAAKFQGDFAKIVQGVNATLDAVIVPLNVAAEYVDRISRGDIPTPITDSYNGDFNTIKNNLNQCIAAVNGLVAEAGRLTDAAVQGKLSTRGDAAKFQGDFAKIVQGVNNTLDAVIGPLNVAAEYVDRISKGDIPEPITDEYNGDFNEIKNNLNILIAAMQTITSIASEMSAGNLTVEAMPRSEQDTLMQALNSMLVKLNQVVAEVKGAAENVADGSQQMSSSSTEMSEGASEQAAAAEETSSSMEEMAANIRQNAENALQTEKIAVKAAQDAEASGRAVSEMVEAMKTITQKISIIEEIARQTHMLSLNATIEAAKAQDYGKGFGVVASEVRSLAERSRTAAVEIARLTTTSTVITERASDMLKQLVPDIRKTAELVQEISAASVEQNKGTAQINDAIQQLDEVIQRNAAVSEEMSSTSEELAAQAEHLQAAVAFFKTNGQTSKKTSSSFKTTMMHLPREKAKKGAEERSSKRLQNESLSNVTTPIPPTDRLDEEFERF
ncbi:methyl-accepting chemotaxis sensory transducer [Candidatus Moduliflexus flocculans]|uniref:Methyl-accepting chemotaxis sensory transducer n=1 Tax=Candidatus Moduliflexus flocculans TaxID=1499966 RepID=A0A081BSJ2_9BACT|nr:methyl-accepting chemotaxis sensory transducer [Candidatus Moduliflexus flocculans]